MQSFGNPYSKIEFVVQKLGVARKAVSRYLKILESQKIGREMIYVNIELIETALETTQKHLELGEEPSVKFSKVWSKGIPQYNVGHKKIVEEIQSVLKNENLVISGNFVGGVSVIDCIKNAKLLVENLAHERR